MKRIIVSVCILMSFFACKKSDSTRPTSSYGQGVTGMSFTYNKAYIFFFQRAGIRDSDRVIFHPNGTVTEVSHRFDSSSYTYPDSLTFTVNTSYDAGIVWENVPNVNLFTFYPIFLAPIPGKTFLLHDYLRTDVINIYKTSGTNYSIMEVTPTMPADSTVHVDGYVTY